MDAMVNSADGSKERSSSVPLMVVENGCGSPCIDLRQVSSELAAAAKDADLVIRSFISKVNSNKYIKKVGLVSSKYLILPGIDTLPPASIGDSEGNINSLF